MIGTKKNEFSRIMNSCWKCGQEISDSQTECVDCLEGLPHFSDSHHTEAELDEMEADFNRNYMEVDWDKVKTLQDLIDVLRVSEEQIFIYKKSPNFDRIKKFLKPLD